MEPQGEQPRKTVSRRDFLRMAGIAGATVGVAGGLGGMLVACGGTDESTTTSAAASSTTDGLVCGDGKAYKITTTIGDSQSDSNRSAQVAADLINNTGISLIGGSSSAANVIPVRDTAESFECPGIYYDCPGDAWGAGLKEPLK